MSYSTHSHVSLVCVVMSDFDVHRMSCSRFLLFYEARSFVPRVYFCHVTQRALSCHAVRSCLVLSQAVCEVMSCSKIVACVYKYKNLGIKQDVMTQVSICHTEKEFGCHDVCSFGVMMS